MPRINIDAIQGLTDPIELRLGGKDYTIKSLDQETVDRVLTLSDDSAEGESLHEVLSGQLAIFTGDDQDVFRKMDARVLSAAVTRIIGVVNDAARKGGSRPKRSR